MEKTEGHKSSDAQRRAYAKYQQKDKKATAKRVAKSSAKRYINKLADVEELEEVQAWLDNRMTELKD
jgi:hypothetical protein